MQSRYDLTTQWLLDASIERIWQALIVPEEWPRWWRYVRSVTTLRSGDADGIGAVRRYTWTSRLPYRLTFDMETIALVRPSVIQAAARGELTGTGCWRLDRAPRGTCVRYEWRVDTRRRWMNRVAPLLAPVFEWNHDQVMAAGGRGLAQHLGVRLLAYTGTSPARRATRIAAGGE